MSHLYFDEEEHAYYLNGEHVPSVTQILRPLSDLSYAQIDPDVLHHAAERGTAVHRCCELYANGTLDTASISAEVLPYYSAFLRFVKEMKPEFLLTEFLVYHPTKKYAGGLDGYIKINTEPYLIDYKCTSKISETAPIQMTAYKDAALYCPEVSVIEERANRAIVWLKKNGTYKFILCDENKYDYEKALFDVLLNKVWAERNAEEAVNQWKEKHK